MLIMGGGRLCEGYKGMRKGEKRRERVKEVGVGEDVYYI